MLTIKQLLAEISLTNNGYIFHPTAIQLEVARQNPDLVKIENGLISKVSTKIEYFKEKMTTAKTGNRVLTNDFDYEGAILNRQESKMMNY